MVGEALKDSGLPNFPTTTKLGEILAAILPVVYFLATFIAFFWLIWGGFQYITAGGEKEKIQQARGRITWAIIGLLVIFAAFFIAQFIQEVLQPKGGTPII